MLIECKRTNAVDVSIRRLKENVSLSAVPFSDLGTKAIKSNSKTQEDTSVDTTCESEKQRDFEYINFD